MAYNVKFTRRKPLLITKAAGAAPQEQPPGSRKGAALTHSLFGRYSASLSFPLVSPGKGKRRELPFVLSPSGKHRRMRTMGNSATPSPAPMREEG